MVTMGYLTTMGKAILYAGDHWLVTLTIEEENGYNIEHVIEHSLHSSLYRSLYSK